ncbi:SDR family NAD(P)-dependent oxidoreductase [Streptomyces himalayensis]|uniref:SDR family NAD(P)-dependent oxidoreductase n=1 Tax=Streptomyces himalayensis subsp. himalayensis TaxID=2756131 RepID=A0A7W0DU23_9ACTN|nr:SDR family NAD(P)-dependent oxidoreductase [Streptomyces himalayensis]MBA2951271.1 SDR family NAD(P)-dependent oxidoreductase [Streptomyces himalayensis subsp. himalayensis]
MTAYELADKVVLITGGTGGLGSATARALLARGARVGIVDLHPDTPELAVRVSPSGVAGFTADVCDRDALDDAVAQICERFGRVDVVIANAGIMGHGCTLHTMPAPAIDKVLAVNVNGALNTVNAAMKQIVANQGQIVLISSVFAFLNGMGAIPYAMSKAAVEQLGRGLRVELAQHGASATTAYFSLIQTDMIRNGVDQDPTIGKLLTRTTPRPLRKRLEPDQAAHAIAHAIEHRSPRVIRPARWTPLSVLRGVINPAIDARLARDLKVRALLGKLEGR